MPIPRLSAWGWTLAILALAAIVGAAVLLSAPLPERTAGSQHTLEELWPGPDNLSMRIAIRDERVAAYELAKSIVLGAMKSPATAVFPDEKTAISHVTDGADYYTVESYVDAENSFGAKVRTDFRFWMRRTGEGPDDWQVLSSRINSR